MLDKGEAMPLVQHRLHNEDELDKTLTRLLAPLFEMDGLDLQSSIHYIRTMLPIIKRKYYHLTPEDIKVFAYRASTRDYGKAYGRLTPSIVLEWLDTFSSLRFDEIEGITQAQHQMYKSPHLGNTSSEESARARQYLNRLEQALVNK